MHHCKIIDFWWGWHHELSTLKILAFSNKFYLAASQVVLENRKREISKAFNDRIWRQHLPQELIDFIIFTWLKTNNICIFFFINLVNMTKKDGVFYTFGVKSGKAGWFGLYTISKVTPDQKWQVRSFIS